MLHRFAKFPVAACVIALSVWAVSRPAAADNARLFRKEIRQMMGSTMSQDEARATAVARAKRDALEEAGTYLESITVVRNFQVQHDEIVALALGITQSRVIEEDPFVESGNFGIRVVVEVRVDNSGLGDRVQAILRDGHQVAQWKAANDREKELLDRISILEEQAQTRANTPPDQDQQQPMRAALRDLTDKLTAQQWFQKGVALWDARQRRYQPAADAIEYFSRCIDLDPKFAWAFHNRGTAYNDLGDFTAAIADFTLALRIDPQLVLAYNGRGMAHFAKGQYEDAILDFDRAIAIDPNSALPFSNRGIARVRMRQYQQGIQDFSRAIELDPKLALAYTNRGAAWADLGQNQRAIKDHSRAIELAPWLALAYNNRGATYLTLREYQQAIEDIDFAISLDPSSAMAYTNRGIAEGHLGKHESAIADFDKAAALDSRYAPAYRNRGGAYWALGEIKKACADWRQGCDLGSQDACQQVRERGC